MQVTTVKYLSLINLSLFFSGSYTFHLRIGRKIFKTTLYTDGWICSDTEYKWHICLWYKTAINQCFTWNAFNFMIFWRVIIMFYFSYTFCVGYAWDSTIFFYLNMSFFLLYIQTEKKTHLVTIFKRSIKLVFCDKW